MGKITKKKYCRIQFVLESPMALSSGESGTTDKDIARDSLGNPYIPGSSIAGVIRDALILAGEPETEINKYLGYVKINTNSSGNSTNDEAVNSKVIFYDAVLIEEKPIIAVRDSVKLDDYKTAEKGAKFDMEVVEPGAVFVTYVEQGFEAEAKVDYVEKIANRFKGGLAFGGKTTRGYGAIKVREIKYADFDLSAAGVKSWLEWLAKPEEDRWIDINPESNNSVGNKVNTPTDWTLTLRLKQVGGISIRRYTTEVSSNDKTQPDMEQLTIHNLSDEESTIPVIPGTSWAGAFRHRMKEFNLTDKEIETVFGKVDLKKKEKEKSQLSFGESQFEGATAKIISRNSIDRFSGSTVGGALFTEKTYYNGTTELVISWKAVKIVNKVRRGPIIEEVVVREREAMDDAVRKALAASLVDLHMGLLAVGGETSIGRGIFKITKINGVETIEFDGNNARPIADFCYSDTEDLEKDGRILYDYILNEIPKSEDNGKAGEK